MLWIFVLKCFHRIGGTDCCHGESSKILCGTFAAEAAKELATL